MPDKPAQPPRPNGRQIVIKNGAIPRMGMSVPMPASTKPPAQPIQQNSTANQQVQK